jgi:hypothetical protein
MDIEKEVHFFDRFEAELQKLGLVKDQENVARTMYDSAARVSLTQLRRILRGNTIEEDFTLEVTTGTVPMDRYDAFVAETHRTDDAFRASTHVRPPTP